MKKKIIYAFIIFLFLCGLAYATAIVSINGNPIGSIVSINGNAVSGIHDIDGNTITHGTCTASFSPSFGNVTGLPLSTLEYSANTTVTLTNCSTATASISGNSGQMKDFTANIDWGTSNITISNGDIIGVRQTTSGSYFTSTTTTLTVASVANASLMQTILAAPTMGTPTAGNTQASIPFTLATGGSTPNGWWGTANGDCSGTPCTCSTKTKVTGLGTPPWVKTGLTNGTVYYFITDNLDANSNESSCSSEVTVTPAIPTNFLTDGNIFAAWNFENNLNDMTTHSHNLTLYAGTAAYNSSTNVQLGSYSANTSTAWCTQNTFTTMPGYVTYTGLAVGGWYQEGSNGTSYLMSTYDSANYNNSWELQLSAGKPEFVITHDGTTLISVTGTSAISTNTPTFIAGVWDGAYIHIWSATGNCSNLAEANTQVAFSSTPYYSTSMTFNDMANSFISSCYSPFGGYSDVHFIFKRSLSQAELSSICVHGLNGSK